MPADQTPQFQEVNTPGPLTVLRQVNLGVYEQLVLHTCSRNPRVYSEVLSLLKTVNAEDPGAIFTKEIHRAYWTVMSHHYKNAPGIPLTVEMTMVVIDNCQRQGLILPTESVLLRDLMLVLQISDFSGQVAYLTGDLRAWVKGRLLTGAALRLSDTDTERASRQLEQIYARLRQVSGAGEEPEFAQRFGMSFFKPEQKIERIPSWSASLNNSIGGGFGVGEATMFIGTPSGGKTVFACQQAAFNAAIGVDTLLISTEETFARCDRRIASNVANIPIERIKDQFDIQSASAEDKKAFLKIHEQLSSKILIADWGRKDKYSLDTDLPLFVEECSEQFAREVPGFNGFKFIIVDWLGGGLQTLRGAKSEQIRFILQNAADTMAEYAKRQKIVALINAQATPKLSVNKKVIDQMCIGECKTMANKMTTVMGVSALYVKSLDDADDTPLYEDRQFFTISKSRVGVGRMFQVRRDFKFMRFLDQK
jgi:hypothetical protein